MVKVPSASHLEAAFYLRINLPEKHWTLLLMGNSVHEAENMLKTYISAQGMKGCDPFAVLLRMLTYYSDFVNKDADALGHEAAILELTTGLGSLGYNAPPEIRVEDLKTKRMSWLIGNIRNADQAVTFQTELIPFIQNLHLKLLSYKVCGNVSIDSLRNSSQDIHEAFQALKSSMKWRRDMVRGSRERAQALYEGVSGSL